MRVFRPICSMRLSLARSARGLLLLAAMPVLFACRELPPEASSTTPSSSGAPDLDGRPGPSPATPVLPGPTNAVPSFAVLQSCAQPWPVGESSVGRVISMKLCLETIGAPAGAQVSLEIRAPKAFVYQRRDFILNAGPASPQRIDFLLPVAGTLIDSGGLAGRWNATFFMDGLAIAEEQFELSP